jgi:hypothetical protein
MAATLLTKSCTKVVALFQVSLGFLVLACLVAPLFAQDTNNKGNGKSFLISKNKTARRSAS